MNPKSHLKSDPCVYFVISPNRLGRKIAKMVFFRTQNDPGVLFHACISSSHWKETCNLHCKTLHFHKCKRYVPLLAFQFTYSFMFRSLHNLSVVLCLFYWKLNWKERSPERGAALAEDTTLLLVFRLINSGYNWILNLKSTSFQLAY